MHTKRMADLAVLVSVGGSAVTYYLADGSFFSGLLQHGFLAATIGGFADWFAIKAIFGKPLGINYRTDILRKNRERILGGLVDFSANDLLETNHIMQVLAKEDFSQLLLNYLQLKGGLEKLTLLSNNILAQLIENFDVNELAKKLTPCFADLLNCLDVRVCLQAGEKRLNRQENIDKVINNCLYKCGKILQAAEVQNILADYLKNILQEYEAGGLGRGMMLSSMGLTVDNLLPRLNEKVLDWLQKNSSEESELHRKFASALQEYLVDMARNEGIIKRLAAWKEKKINEQDFQAYLIENIEKIIEANRVNWQKQIKNFLEEYLAKFAASSEQRQALHNLIFNFLAEKLEKNKHIIPQIMQEQLNMFSDDEIVTLAEERVADDLQMIRINGAIVGALAGMILFSLKVLLLRGVGM